MEAIKNLRSLAIRAHQWTSFTPEKRGEQIIEEYSKDLVALLTEIPEEHHDWVTEKYVNLLSAWLNAKSRCISPMITGPANFPTKRAERFNNWEQADYEAFRTWRNNIARKLERRANKENWSLEGEIHRLTNEVETLKTNHERMKTANKILGSKKLTYEEKADELANIGFPDIEELKNVYGGVGFLPFQLTNISNKIKGREARISELQKRIEAREVSPTEKNVNGIRIVENIAEDRLQLFFAGVPEPRIREILKRNGYRWSPKNQCWQSYLSGKWKLDRVLSEIA